MEPQTCNGHLEERSSSWSHMLGTQISLDQGLGAINFRICHSILGWDLKIFHWKVFKKMHDDTYDVSCQSAFFNNLS